MTWRRAPLAGGAALVGAVAVATAGAGAGEGPEATELSPGEAQDVLGLLRENVVRGLVEAGRALEQRPGEQRVRLGRRYGQAARLGVPPAFRSVFDGWRSIELVERGGRVDLTLRFDRWVRAARLGQGTVQLHDVGLYLSRARVVQGRLALAGMRDRRVTEGPPYAEVKLARDDTLLACQPAEPLADHPWGPDGFEPEAGGVEAIRGFSLQTTCDGFWRTRLEVVPVERIFVYGDGRDEHAVWITYLDTEDYEREVDEVVAPCDDPGFTPAQAFRPYWERAPSPDDRLGFFDMTTNSRVAERADE